MNRLSDLIKNLKINAYPLLTIFHLVLGIFLYCMPKHGLPLGAILLSTAVLVIVKTQNKNQEVLFAVAYFAGFEVLLRMLGGTSYEFSKYAVLLLAALGIFLSGVSKKSWLYLLYLALLLVSLLMVEKVWQVSRPLLNLIVFNLSGPICLGVLSIYTFGKKISFERFSGILTMAALPTLSLATLVFLRSPDISAMTISDSNLQFSGGFGPNQVATALGMGMFVFFFRAVLHSGSTKLLAINLVCASFVVYVGLLTFSRGGMITGLCTVLVMLALVLLSSGNDGRAKARRGLTVFTASFTLVFTLICFQTDGLLAKRYTNRDHTGRFKKPKEGDRQKLALKEVELFIDNPLVGAGVVGGEEKRKSSFGKNYHSHGEFTRMLGEHGSMGAAALLILLLTPARLLYTGRQHLLVATLFVFWFLTINHSGMRLVAPAFFYALMLLQIDFTKAAAFLRFQSKRRASQAVHPQQTALSSI